MANMTEVAVINTRLIRDGPGNVELEYLTAWQSTPEQYLVYTN